MKVLLSWLRDFAPIETDPEELGLVMGDLGMAVEEMDRIGEGLDGIVVAEVLGLRPHPDADKIQLVDVDAGDGEVLQVCCGAFNMSVGDLVPLATIGTTMPNGMEIARRKLRGEYSNGMLCAPSEINLPGDPDGILILGDGLVVGTPLTEALGLTSDVLYDLEINPNRPDAMSIAGVARDVAARLGLPFDIPSPARPDAMTTSDRAVGVEIVDEDRCGRFTAQVLGGVTVGPSDPLVASRLTLLGMRPINNIVDISNYLMLELGQPSHPYDVARLGGQGFRIRCAQAGEQITTLDGVRRELTDADLLICDGVDEPIGIAGIMGGADTEISSNTTDVVVEMAWFAQMPVARSSRRLGLRSEASARFERGCDPEVISLAQERFAAMAGVSAGSDGAAVAVGPLVDARGRVPDRAPIRVRTSRVNAILGSRFSAREIKELLDPIGFGTEIGDGEDLSVALPSYRLDSSVEIDVIEEVGRMYGYSRLGKTMPSSALSGGLTPRQRDRRRLRELASGLGACEATPMPFLAPGDLAMAGLDDDGITITNPLVAEESVLRTSLLPGLLKAVRHNIRHRNADVALFEIGHVFLRPEVDGAELPDERESMAIIVLGAEAPVAVGAWRTLCDGLAVPDADVVNGATDGMHPTRSGLVRVGSAEVGRVGEIDPEVLAAFDIDQRVAYLEIDLDSFLAQPHGIPTYRPVSRFPSADIDLALAVDDRVSATDVEATLAAAAGDVVTAVELFDTYRGPGLPEGARSLAYRVRLQADDRTLSDTDIAAARQAMIDAAAEVHGAALRG